MVKTIKVTCPPWGSFPVGESEIPFIRQSPKKSGMWGDFQFIINREIESCDGHASDRIRKSREDSM